MRLLSLFFLIIILLKGVFSQKDTLPEVQVEANKINDPSETYKLIELDVKDYNSLNEVLQENSAIYLKSYGVGNLSTVSIRGASASQTQIVWNGFNINSPTLGQNDLSISSTSLIDEASLQLGASSTVNSSGGLGGAILLDNKPDFNLKTNIYFSQEVGSFGINNSILKLKLGSNKWQSFSGLVRKYAMNNFEYRNFVKKEPEIVRQINSEYEQIELSQNLYFKPNVNHLLSLKLNIAKSNRMLPSIMGVETSGEKQLDDVLRSAFEWSYNSGSYFQQFSIGYFYDFLNYIDTTASINSEVGIHSFKAYYKGKYYFTDSSQVRLSFTTDKTLANSTNFDSRKYQVRDAVFLEYYHLFKNSISSTVSLRKEFITNIASPFIPSLSLKYNKWEKHKLFFSVAKNFRAPTLNDLYWNPGGNPNLLPENGITTELGYSFDIKNLIIGVTGFYSFINDWIQWLPSNKGFWSPINLKEVESYGLEFKAEKRFKCKLFDFSLVGNYNLVIAKNKSSVIEDDASISNQLIYVPKHTASFRASIDYKSFMLSYRHSYNGIVFIDAANQTYMPYYAPASLTLDWYTGQTIRNTKLTLGIRIDNLYNEEYQIVANRPMPGQFYRLIFKINFNK